MQVTSVREPIGCRHDLHIYADVRVGEHHVCRAGIVSGRYHAGCVLFCEETGVDGEHLLGSPSFSEIILLHNIRDVPRFIREIDDAVSLAAMVLSKYVEQPDGTSEWRVREVEDE